MITIGRKAKLTLAVGVIGILVSLSSCSISGTSSEVGGSAGIAQAQARATATAEVQMTGTAAAVDAKRLLEEGYTRATQIAKAGSQGTLVAQEQEMNDLVITNARAQLTATAEARATAKSATATEMVAQQTEVANMRTATAQAVTQSQQNDETSARFWSWMGFLVVAAFVCGVILLFWFLYTRMSVRTTPSGKTIVIKGKPTDLIRRDFSGLTVEVIDPVDTSAMPSAAPALPPYAPMVITSGTAGNRQATVTNKAVPTDREMAWREFARSVDDFTTLVYEYCREAGDATERIIPRWKTLADHFNDRNYINARWWTVITDALVEAKVLEAKEQGKPTKLALDGPCKTVTDLHVLSVRRKLLPTTPPLWFGIDGRKNYGNSDSLEQLEQSEQPEQHINPVLDSAVAALPSIPRND